MATKQQKQWQVKLKKIGIGAAIAMAGALATYLEQTIPGIDFGGTTPIIVALNSVMVNAIRNYFREL